MRRPAPWMTVIVLCISISYSVVSLAMHEPAMPATGIPESVWESFADRWVMAGFDSADEPEVLTGQENTQNPIVPEPVTMFLVGSGLIGLAGLTRKLKKRTSPVLSSEAT